MNNIEYKNGKLYILDQTRLPNEEVCLEMKSLEDCYHAIKLLQVRGAPAIGIFAAYSLALFHGNNIEKAKEYLDSSRPTAVNLTWATARIVNASEQGKNPIDEAIAIHNEDIEMCRKISEYGLSLLKDGDGIFNTLQCRRACHVKIRHRARSSHFRQGKRLQFPRFL